jgi:hypothetical protein
MNNDPTNYDPTMNRSRTHKARHDRAVMEVNREYPDDKGTRNKLAVGGVIALFTAIVAIVMFFKFVIG